MIQDPTTIAFALGIAGTAFGILFFSSKRKKATEKKAQVIYDYSRPRYPYQQNPQTMEYRPKQIPKQFDIFPRPRTMQKKEPDYPPYIVEQIERIERPSNLSFGNASAMERQPDDVAQQYVPQYYRQENIPEQQPQQQEVQYVPKEKPSYKKEGYQKKSRYQKKTQKEYGKDVGFVEYEPRGYRKGYKKS